MNCRKQNCPYPFEHSHGVLALVFPRKPKGNPLDLDAKLKAATFGLGSMEKVMSILNESIGPIGQVIYDPADGGGGDKYLAYFMMGPLDPKSDYHFGAQRSWVLLEPGIKAKADYHDYSKPVGPRQKCDICKKVPYAKCQGHGRKPEAWNLKGTETGKRFHNVAFQPGEKSRWFSVSDGKNIMDRFLCKMHAEARLDRGNQLGVPAQGAAAMLGFVRMPNGQEPCEDCAEETQIVTCSHCGTKNRVSIKREARCGRCKTNLTVEV